MLRQFLKCILVPTETGRHLEHIVSALVYLKTSCSIILIFVKVRIQYRCMSIKGLLALPAEQLCLIVSLLSFSSLGVALASLSITKQTTSPRLGTIDSIQRTLMTSSSRLPWKQNSTLNYNVHAQQQLAAMNSLEATLPEL